MFRRAQRRRARLRLALAGPSGAGKTYSALLIARGRVGPEGTIALIDTERGSGDLYADLMAYDVATLDPPYTPRAYMALLREAQAYDVVIIDSLSHAWSGEGGILDMVDQAGRAARGNKFAGWREVTPQHNALVDAILAHPGHVIVTLRTKTAWEVVTNSRGKAAPVKVGLKPEQREGLEYEFTVVLDLAVDGHVATASKDRTQIFDGSHEVPSLATGERLRVWLDGGTPTPDPMAALIASIPYGPEAMITAWGASHAEEVRALRPDQIAEIKTAYIERLADARRDEAKAQGYPEADTMGAEPTEETNA